MLNFSINKKVNNSFRLIPALILFCGFFSVSYGAVTIKPASNNGLVLYWSMNQGTGSSLTDLSGNGNTGTLSFTTWATKGVIGPGVDMGSGGSGNIATSDNSSVDFGTGSFTISMWGKYRDLTYPKNYFQIRKGSTCYAGSYPTWELGDSYGGGLRVCIRDATNNLAHGTLNFNSGYTPAELLNKWVNLVVVFNRSTGRVYSYVNGVKQSSEIDISNVTGSVNNSSGLYSGSVYGWTQDSVVDEYRMYNRALDDNEIKNLYRLNNSNHLYTNSLKSGLVAYYNFDEGTGGAGATIYDRSGSGYHLTISGTPTKWLNGRFGKALQFSGSNNYASVIMDEFSNSNVTMAAWVYLDSASKNGSFIKLGAGGDGFGIGVGASTFENSGNDLILLYEGVRWIDTNTPIGTGWHHVAMVINGSGVPSAYLDGQLINSYSGTGPLLPTIITYIGGYATNRYFNGPIDEVRLYASRALSSSEINDLYKLSQTTLNAPQTNYDSSGLVGYWTFNGTDLTTTTATDKSGSGYHGTLQSSPTPYPGKVGQALSFSGANYVSTTLDTQPSAMANTSWSAWVRPTRLNYGTRQAIFGTDDGGYDRGLEIEANTSNFAIATGSSFWQPVAADLNAWQHVTVVYTPTNIYFYKNGTQYTYGSAPSGQSTAVKFNIGNSPLFSEYFQGQIDEVMVYNRALNSTEINKSYRKTLR